MTSFEAPRTSTLPTTKRLQRVSPGICARAVLGASALAMVALLAPALASPAAAGERSRVVEDGPQFSEHPKSSYYRGRGTRVRGYLRRRGGYSYNYLDGATDHRDTSILRDYQNSRTQGGPFDSGFFFDSGLHRHNESPYP